MELDAMLRSLDQTLLNPKGLPGRDWFQHMIYAPDLKTGYDVKTLPGVREAIEDRRWPDAEKFAAVIGDALGVYCDQLDKITALLKSGG
jgi:N-acetylated-alpha-linked acidic dipeptidase